MSAPTKFSHVEAVSALLAAGGNVVAAARVLDVSRGALNKRLAASPELRRALTQIRRAPGPRACDACGGSGVAR